MWLEVRMYIDEKMGLREESKEGREEGNVFRERP